MEATTISAFGDTILKLAEENENIVVLYVGDPRELAINEFIIRYPERVINFGEDGRSMVGAAAGLAIAGKNPILCGSALLTSEANHEITEAIAYGERNVKIIGIDGGIGRGDNGAMFQSLTDISLMRQIPGMRVLCPADYEEAVQVIEAMMNDHFPAYIRLNNYLTPVFYNHQCHFALGKMEQLLAGKDLTIFVTGGVTVNAMMAAEKLREQTKFSAQVMNVSSLKPIDQEKVIKCARETGRVMTIEDHAVSGGLGSIVAEILIEKYPTPLRRIGIKDAFGASGMKDDLWEKYGLGAETIYQNISEFLNN